MTLKTEHWYKDSSEELKELLLEFGVDDGFYNCLSEPPYDGSLESGQRYMQMLNYFLTKCGCRLRAGGIRYSKGKEVYEWIFEEISPEEAKRLKQLYWVIYHPTELMPD